MTFTNITRTGIYMLCCHREVEPGGSFSLPWTEARHNRALRAAMANGVLSWASSDGEPEVAGSPSVTPADLRRAEAERARRAEAAKAAYDARVVEQEAKDDEAVKENMARMGNFKVPNVGAYTRKVEARETEKPVTEADIIADDKPKSLADIKRHNKAVKMAVKK